MYYGGFFWGVWQFVFNGLWLFDRFISIHSCIRHSDNFIYRTICNLSLLIYDNLWLFSLLFLVFGIIVARTLVVIRG